MSEWALSEWDDELKAAFQSWLITRPLAIQAMAAAWPPWQLYRLCPTGQCCTIEAYAENGTVRVAITGEYNLHLFDRSVFGINPHDLAPCELPQSDEPRGALFTDMETVKAFCVSLREQE